MAQIDVSDLLLDPDFINPVVLVHRKQLVNSTGEGRILEECENTVGSVQPASGKTLNRLPDALRIQNVSSFWIKAGIVADSSCQYPDIIIFNNKRYVVQNVQDWTNFGAGWVEGTCIAESPTG
jgi:galactose-6-phosphate isomerase